MARWFKRVLLVTLLGTIVLLLIAAVLAWRAGQTPGWYAAAVDQTPPETEADDAFNRKLIPLANWLAKSSAGDLSAKSDAEKTHTLEITDAEINAIIAKVMDNRRGPAETFRVRLIDNAAELACTLTDYGRVATVTAEIGKTADGLPTVALGSVKLGNQPAPAWLVSRLTAGPVNSVRADLDRLQRVGKPPQIDERDAASENAVKAAYGRLLLDLLAGRSVPPPGLLPANRDNNKFVATRVTQLDITPGTLRATFRMMTPAERDELLRQLNGPLPVP